MTESEIIKNLQNTNYVRAFGLMSSEEQEVYRKVGKINCIIYSENKDWRNATEVIKNHFRNLYTYAIKPDYEPEPEYVDLEIVAIECSDIVRSSIKWLGVQSCLHRDILPYDFTHLHCLPSLPNFVCFYVVAEDLRPNLNVDIDICDVAKHIAKGHKVYARFRK